MPPLSTSQKSVARAMLGAILVSVAALGLAATLLPSTLRPSSIDQALRCLAVLPLPLSLSIAALAQRRFFSAEDIDGGAVGHGSEQAARLQAILQNTLEQTVLAALVYLGWMHLAPASRLGVIPIATMLFLTGRLLFARGYAAGAPARAFGFGLSFYPTVLIAVGNIALFVLACFRP